MKDAFFYDVELAGGADLGRAPVLNAMRQAAIAKCRTYHTTNKSLGFLERAQKALAHHGDATRRAEPFLDDMRAQIESELSRIGNAGHH
ncbi:hypothetical protein BFP70_02745 [Thioclava sp. SK-1]|uniref:hypothetical protein n=1 Tax=Thioclava sp. SK-1 TaxID=1889770 RepID=UPI000824E922|nr:hypothetical protein [Thioclava sp. SK-1]OCX67097.1 hypothetical protein BFP70_02745 [Thioclava sp. SK-1]